MSSRLWENLGKIQKICDIIKVDEKFHMGEAYVLLQHHWHCLKRYLYILHIIFKHIVSQKRIVKQIYFLYYDWNRQQYLKPFVPNALFLYLLKTSENPGVEKKGCIGSEWIKVIIAICAAFHDLVLLIQIKKGKTHRGVLLKVVGFCLQFH